MGERGREKKGRRIAAERKLSFLPKRPQTKLGRREGGRRKKSSLFLLLLCVEKE